MVFIKKIATILLMIIGYLVAIFCFALFYMELHFKFLLIGVVCIILPSFLYYLVFYKPRKKIKENLKFYLVFQEFSKKLSIRTFEDIKKLSSESSEYKPMRGEVFLEILENVSLIEINHMGLYSTQNTSSSKTSYSDIMHGIDNKLVALKKQQNVLKQGRLIITTLAFIFEGKTQYERVDWEKVASTEVFPEGVIIKKEDGISISLLIDKFHPLYGAMFIKLTKENKRISNVL